EVYKEASEKSPAFKKIYESMVKFREDQLLWFRVAEKGFDDFMHTIHSIKCPPRRRPGPNDKPALRRGLFLFWSRLGLFELALEEAARACVRDRRRARRRGLGIVAAAHARQD